MVSNIWQLLSDHFVVGNYDEKLHNEMIDLSNTSKVYFFECFGGVYEKHHSNADLQKILDETEILSQYFENWHVKTNNTFDSTTEKGFHIHSGSKDLGDFLNGNGQMSAGGHTLKMSDITNEDLLIDSKNHIVRLDIVAERCFESDCSIDDLKKMFPLDKNKKI